jgi:hypothetical protein
MGVDEVAVSDDSGEFVFVTRKPTSVILAKIEAPGFARQTASIAVGGAPAQFRLVRGAIVRGRLVDRGAPVGGVEVGAVQENRRAGEFLGPLEATTDSDGRFVFWNLPPKMQMFVYGKMDSLGERGEPGLAAVTTTNDGGSTDLGDLPLTATHRIDGRVVLTDGKPVPEKTRITIGREKAWDWVEVEIGRDGRYSARGIPPEPVSISLRVKGYMLSVKNPNLDGMNNRIVGRVTRDLDGFTLLLDPGEPQPLLMPIPPAMRKPPPGIPARDRPLESPPG